MKKNAIVVPLLMLAWQAGVALAGPGIAKDPVYRQDVLPQVTMPHAYYWRGLYVPQLSSSPSYAAFSPAGDEVIYSMAGSLWRQKIGSAEAFQLTSGPGYDFQADWSPDGRSIVFTRRLGDAMELNRLDLASGKVEQLTSFAAVTLEPRFSPDGKRVAFVSSRKSGYFDLYVADIGQAGLANVRPLVAGRRSAIDRYYYGPYDHAINPSWSPDGSRIVYVSNAEVGLGTGDIWSVAIENPEDRRKIISEETSWRARPELAPDGKRLLFSSYHGRQWHQLWLSTVDGAAPLPLTFGNFDRMDARWSADGKRVLYTSNERGPLSLWVQEFAGGARKEIVPAERHYKSPMTSLAIELRDAAGTPISGRVAVMSNADQRYYGPADARMMADDGFIAGQPGGEIRYFHCSEKCSVALPAGGATVTVWSGLERMPERRQIDLPATGPVTSRFALRPNLLPEKFGAFLSADYHVHMNYGGAYRLTYETLAADAQAEDLDVVYNLIVNKEERVPGIEEFSPRARTFGKVTIFDSQEGHTSYWGHLGLLHLDDHVVLPDFSSYRHTALASPYPHNGVMADLAHAEGAVVGYVHPFDNSIADLSKLTRLTHTLPVDAALGKVDYLEIVSFADHASTAGVWYRLLNLGFRVAAGAGTDAMANMASLRGPVGLDRAYLPAASPTPDALREAIRKRQGFVTNAPLLGLIVNDAKPGEEVTLTRNARRVHVEAAMRSIVPVRAVELVQNGRVIKRLPISGDGRSADFEGDVEVGEGGWLLLRAVSPDADPLLMDYYAYGTTNPIWLTGIPAPDAAADARYFLQWIDLVIQGASQRSDYNEPKERAETLAYLEAGRRVFAARLR